MEPAESWPVFEEDLFSDESLANSQANFKKLRELGEAVWVPSIDMFVIARYDAVAAALRASDKLISGWGVSINEMQFTPPGDSSQVSTITSDGDLHRRIRRVEMKPLMPASLKAIREQVAGLADECVRSLVDGNVFDAMEKIASYVPVSIVADMVGVRGVDAERLRRWSSAAFDAFGPITHRRTHDAVPLLEDLTNFVAELDRDRLIPGGWAWQLMEAADRGELSEREASLMVTDYVVPSIDTTVYAIGEMLCQLAMNPSAMATLRERPKLIMSAVYESVRLASPIRGFSRRVTEDYSLTTTRTIPAGSRVWLLYAAANRDERHYTNPDRFDVERNPRDQLGWGLGAHHCVGKHLAQLEMESILRALVRQVERIEMDGTPTRIVNNGLQGYGSLPMRLVGKA